MSGEYVTSGGNLPEDPEGREIRLQVSDPQTKEIFDARARISRDRDDLDDPNPLTVVRGPHENIEEQWYIDVLDADDHGDGGAETDEEADGDHENVDEDLLRSVIKEIDNETNVINTRSEDLKTILTYLTERDEYDSVSEASRSLMTDHLRSTRPELFETYVDCRMEVEREKTYGDPQDGA